MSSVAAASRAHSPRAELASQVRELWARRETIQFLVSSQLKEGHRDKLLGNLWNILDPLLLMAVYYLVFGVALRLGGDDPLHFLAYLYIGVLVWRFLDASIQQSTQVIRGNRGLVHEIRFPKSILPIAACLARAYDLIWGLLVLVLVLAAAKPFSADFALPLTANLLWAPYLLFLQMAFVIGLAFFAAYLGAFYADTSNVAGAGLRLWFFASPVFYYVSGPHATVPAGFSRILLLNPVAGFLEGQRAVLIHGQMPEQLPYLTLVSLLTLAGGFGLFSRGEGAFVKYV